MEKNYEKLCICAMCPTYVNCGEPKAFCLYTQGKSKCITTMHGCICPGCPVHEEKGFLKDYYCINGKE
jgi:hypothetical protein